MEQIPNLNEATSREIAEELIRVLYRKGASEIRLYDVSEDTSLTDFHLIVTARSSTHVRSLADDADFEMSERGVKARATEGKETGNWALLDFYTVILHIFDTASRDFYRLERLLKPEHLVNIDAVIASAKQN